MFVICSKDLVEESSPEKIREFRLSKIWAEHVVRNSIDFLHKQFVFFLIVYY